MVWGTRGLRFMGFDGTLSREKNAHTAPPRAETDGHYLVSSGSDAEECHIVDKLDRVPRRISDRLYPSRHRAPTHWNANHPCPSLVAPKKITHSNHCAAAGETKVANNKTRVLVASTNIDRSPQEDPIACTLHATGLQLTGIPIIFPKCGTGIIFMINSSAPLPSTPRGTQPLPGV